MRCLIAICLILVGAGASRAQQAAAAIPARPRLKAAADTNDAAAYYSHGTITIAKQPAVARSSFYWASRLDPEMADAYYGHAIAIVLAFDDSVHERHMNGGNSERDPTDAQVIEYDSLMHMGFARDPFLDPRYNLMLFPAWVRQALPRSTDPELRGDYAFAMHEYAHANAEWAAAFKKEPKRLDLRLRRARAFYYLQEYDSAYAEFAFVVNALEAKQQQELGWTKKYESKAMDLYEMGIIREMQGRKDDARELYGRALVEDIGWYMAHVRLAGLAAAAGDTTAALAEWALAAEIKNADPSIFYRYAAMLAAAGRTEDALKQLRAAIAMNPDYAAPYELVGRLEDARGRTADAVRAYREFLQRAPRDSPARATVEKRLQSGIISGETK
jgi:tetratricopeptide (TPR) repeat protein